MISKALAAIGLKHVPIPADPRPAAGALDQLFVRGLDVERIYVDTTVKNSDHFPIFADLVVA